MLSALFAKLSSVDSVKDTNNTSKRRRDDCFDNYDGHLNNNFKNISTSSNRKKRSYSESKDHLQLNINQNNDSNNVRIDGNNNNNQRIMKLELESPGKLTRRDYSMDFQNTTSTAGNDNNNIRNNHDNNLNTNGTGNTENNIRGRKEERRIITSSASSTFKHSFWLDAINDMKAKGGDECLLDGTSNNDAKSDGDKVWFPLPRRNRRR